MCNYQSYLPADLIVGYVFPGSNDQAKRILGYILPALMRRKYVRVY